MSICIEGKTILITGASSGIGEATAKACIASGMKCVITARRKDKLQTLADELGDQCSFVVGDVTEEGFNEHLLKQSEDVYAIFANAGHGLDQEVVDYNQEQCKDLFNLNVFAAIELASLAATEMIKKKQGHILFCASCLSKFATPHHGAYSASKSALEAFAKSMRMEMRDSGVFISTVHPIGTRTEFFDESARRSGRETSEFTHQAPSWLMQPPEKVANAVVGCLRRPKPECWTSVPMRLISTLFTAFPRVAGVIAKRFS